MSVGSWFTLQPIRRSLEQQGFQSSTPLTFNSATGDTLTVSPPPGASRMVVFIKYTNPTQTNNEILISTIKDVSSPLNFFNGCNAVRANTSSVNMVSGMISPISGNTYNISVFRQSDNAQVNISNVVWYYAFV
jgi:hypothetical protein